MLDLYKTDSTATQSKHSWPILVLDVLAISLLLLILVTSRRWFYAGQLTIFSLGGHIIFRLAFQFRSRRRSVALALLLSSALYSCYVFAFSSGSWVWILGGPRDGRFWIPPVLAVLLVVWSVMSFSACVAVVVSMLREVNTRRNS